MTGAKLIIINGLSASGKSTLAPQIAKKLQLPLFSKDDFKELLADTVGLLDYENTKKFGKVSYLILFLIAKQCSQNGVSLIIEGNFTLGKETQEFVFFLKDSGIDAYEILCHAEGQVLVDRFLKRKRHMVHHNLDEDAYMAFAETLRTEKIPSLSVGKYMEVDTTDPSQIRYEEIIKFIET